MRLLLSTLLRLLFPSWAFFDVATATPELEVRRAPPDGEAGAWQRAVRVAPRQWWHLLWNPSGTRALAEQALVERLDVLRSRGDDASPEGLVSQALVERLAASAVPPEWLFGPRAGWQYRVAVTGEPDAPVHDGSVAP